MKGGKSRTLVHSLSNYFLSAESWFQKSTFPARMRFENVQLAVCNRSVGFGLASVCSPVGGVAIDVAEITHVSTWDHCMMNGGENKLLLAGTKVGRMENTRSEICKLCLFTCKTATTSAGLMVCVIHKNKLCHWLLDLVAKKVPWQADWGKQCLRMKELSLLFKPQPCFFNIFVFPSFYDSSSIWAKHRMQKYINDMFSSWSRARLLVDKCFSDQSERQKKKLVSEGGGNNLSLCLC